MKRDRIKLTNVACSQKPTWAMGIKVIYNLDAMGALGAYGSIMRICWGKVPTNALTPG